MNVLIVYAHHEPTSFTSALKNVSLKILETNQQAVSVSDLYSQGFQAVASKIDFNETSGEHFNYMSEQKYASLHNMSFSPDIADEIEKLKHADLIIFHFPLWWSSVPAILKGWLDRILVMGVAWDGRDLIYSNGLLRGKQALTVVTTGEPIEHYQPEGLHKGTVEQMLHPLLYGTFAYCGLDVLQPYVIHDVLNKTDDQRNQMLELYASYLGDMLASPKYYIKF